MLLPSPGRPCHAAPKRFPPTSVRGRARSHELRPLAASFPFSSVNNRRSLGQGQERCPISQQEISAEGEGRVKPRKTGLIAALEHSTCPYWPFRPLAFYSPAPCVRRSAPL